MEHVDVIVLGCGPAGMTAAIAAHEAGAKVELIERFDRIGGTGAVSGGVIWVADNPRQRAAGLEDSREEALAYFRSLDHGDLVDETLEAFVDQGPKALDFLEQAGALKVALLDGYPDYYLDRPGAKAKGGRALDHDLFSLDELGDWAGRITAIEEAKPMMLRETPLGGGTGVVPPEELARRMANNERGFGQAMVGRLLKACLDRGIEPHLNAKTRRLLRDGGRITGIEIVREGRNLKLMAQRGVIVATGGFEWDREMRQAFLRGPMDAPASPPTARGEGLALAMAAGAKLGNMTQGWWAPTLVIPDNPWPQSQFGGEQRAVPVLIERTVPHSLMVNRAGKRFCNEAANYSALAGAFHQFDAQSYDYPNLPAWLVFDANYVERYPIGPRLPGQPVLDWVARADSLKDLAGEIGVDAVSLRGTVERFNRHCDAGHDPDFERGTSAYDHFYGDRSREGAAVTLGKLERAPFYAVEIRMGVLGTNGGPRTDGEARILGHDGEPIPGLYGAGNAIACPTGGIYAGAGGTLGPALTFGYIAGRSAARANA
ncbi:FAD-dependent oxidoreductase [Erythrobacter sp. THAF29]|uniref:FAD-dependent oxidoreductase n=1 Tax=Erythrobacter sp. THAF29 TaxID=2587851 RepID=UPI00126938B2|nr:FAD-dependent oxidoreductase [Erythrobacter sp. THAF29]QFT76237.1 3-oxosteroid 1-dehydrogenase [Erythrobacter sp. THAF29]